MDDQQAENETVDGVWRVVWITGASTGIGRDLALQIAKLGSKVAISARSKDTLAEAADQHPNIYAYPLDVTDADAVTAAAAQIANDLGPIDLAVFNAGVYTPMSLADTYDTGSFETSISVNYLGCVYGVGAVLGAMRARGAGHIALVASVAGYRGLPNASAYAASKAALIAYTEVLYQDLRHTPLTISLINPGFVDTPMTSVNDFDMPFMITSDKAAALMIAGLQKRKFEIVFPWQMKIIMKLIRVLPYRSFFWLTRGMNEPASKS